MSKSKDSSVQVAAIVAGLLVVIGGAWLFLNSGTEEAIETTQISTTTDNTNTATDSSFETKQISADAALQMAEMAFQSGQLTGDEEGSAVDFYRQVLDQDPENARAKAGMQLISTQLADEAEDLMAKGDYQQVVEHIDALNKIEPDSDAALVLQQQLAEESTVLFNEMDNAIVIGQLDEAERLAGSLRLIPVADSGRISAAMVTIAQVRKASEYGAAEALPLAAGRQELQKISTTETAEFVSNSGYDYETTPGSDSDVASSEVSIKSAESLKGAGVEVNGSDGMEQAQSPGTVKLVDPKKTVRNQIASLLKEAAAKVEQNRLITPAGDNAVELYNQVLALETTNTEAKRRLRGIVQKLTSGAYDRADAGDIDGAREALDLAESVGIAQALVTQARIDVRAKWLETESKKVFSVGGFEVEKSVPPKYPKRAMSRSIEGWVKVEFTVAEDGKTRDLQVVESSEKLAKQFSRSAMSAVEQWRFKPRVLDGEVIAQRSETLVQFKLID